MTEVEEMTKSQADEKINSDYRFVSSNASNMIQQLRNIRKDIKKKRPDLPLLDNKLSTVINLNKKNGWLENSLLIVDEAHNIFNSIVNGSKLGIEFYDMIMKTKNIKILFLTGTPVINNVFELVPCFNMLFGYTFFPEFKDQFNNWFIDENNNSIKNKDKFTNYLIGRITYYGTEYFTGSVTQKDFPKELPIKIINAPMSIYQYTIYNNARVIEKAESINKQQQVPSRFGTSGKKMSSTYRVKTRQISNFAFPQNIYSDLNKKLNEIKRIRDKKEAQKLRKTLKSLMVLQLTTDNLNRQGLQMYSPKMLHIIDNINKEMADNKRVGMVYSEFVTGEGLAIFSKILLYLGWNKYKINKNSTGGYDGIYDLSKILDIYGGKSTLAFPQSKNLKKSKSQILSSKGIFAIVSGEVDPETRSEIIRQFNSDKNIRGELINLLLLSSTAAEGIDLKGVRHIHIMEPYWNMARINQIKARGIRYMSHKHLNSNEQNVQVYMYLSTYPEKRKKEKIEELITDRYIYNRAINNQIIIDKFLKILIESSVDCSLHKSNALKSNPSIIDKNIKCKICTPNNKKIYHTDMREDLMMENKCIELENDNISNLTEQITAKELVLDGGKKFYYYINPPSKNVSMLSRIHVYEYNSDLDGYTELSSDSEFYPSLLEKIMEIIDT